MLGIISDNPTIEELTEQIKLTIEELADIRLTLESAIKVVKQNREAIKAITDWGYQATDKIEEATNCIKGQIKKYYEDGHPHSDKKTKRYLYNE